VKEHRSEANRSRGYDPLIGDELGLAFKAMIALRSELV